MVSHGKLHHNGLVCNAHLILIPACLEVLLEQFLLFRRFATARFVAVQSCVASIVTTDGFWDARAVDSFHGVDRFNGGSAFDACAVLSLSCYWFDSMLPY